MPFSKKSGLYFVQILIGRLCTPPRLFGWLDSWRCSLPGYTACSDEKSLENGKAALYSVRIRVPSRLWLSSSSTFKAWAQPSLLAFMIINLHKCNGLCKWFPPQITLMLFDQSNHIHSICISNSSGVNWWSYCFRYYTILLWVHT